MYLDLFTAARRRSTQKGVALQMLYTMDPAWSSALTALAFAPPLRALNAEAECGPRGEIRVSENDADGDGTSYGLYCWNDGNVWGPPMVGHHASALAILVAVAFGIVTAVSLSRWPAKARG